jgi:SAM-dependent methyltransferase
MKQVEGRETRSTPRRWAVEQVIKLGAGVLDENGPAPLNRILAPIRAESARRTAERFADQALDASECPENPRMLSAIADAALREMRLDVQHKARQLGPLTRLTAFGDRRWNDCDSTELLDHCELEPELRTKIMSTLDDFNRLVNGYDNFIDALLPLIVASGRSSTSVLDLAAGHGGFAIAVAQAARRRDLAIEITASDIKPEYLELGRQELTQHDEKVHVDFVVQDALDLSNLERGAFDIITCTQSLHHFPPGAIAVMLRSALRAAGAGVVFVDGCRSVLTGVGLALYGTLGDRNLPFVHDAWISVRKFFVPEELELLALLACPTLPEESIEARWLPPGYCLLMLES